ncbi:MAG: hypothetical protein OQK70_09240 [Gammaproteobacteria bacterium]|nr:hypothetical protein [Gammaproteobacteria bacterium]
MPLALTSTSWKKFDITPNPEHCTELTLITSAPLFVACFSALYPVLIIDLMVGIAVV